MDKEFQQAVESLHAACWELSKLIPSVTVSFGKRGDHLFAMANLLSVEDMNKIPVIPQIRDKGDSVPARQRYRIIKNYGGIEWCVYCDEEQLLGLVVNPTQEVASDA
ncbi:MAG TPA: hypothetical protein GX696_12070 [Pseudomonadaceae bacterium]|nr:hypothetical protein [Pseudomonadaceae bacterium]